MIDGFEDDLARVELGDGRLLDLPRSWLPAEALEGDHLTVSSDGHGLVQFSLDPDATRAALERNQAALDQLNSQDPGGDLKL